MHVKTGRETVLPRGHVSVFLADLTRLPPDFDLPASKVLRGGNVRKRVIAFASSSSPFSGREIFVTFRSQSTFDHSRRSFYLSNGY